MIYLTHRPRAPLSHAVEVLWLYSGYQPPHQLERVLPSGRVEMVINLREDVLRCYHPETFRLQKKLRGVILAGPRQEVQIVDTAQQLEIMGVHFLPGGAHAMFGMPVDELRDLDVPLHDVWGEGAADAFRSRVAEAHTPQGKLLALEQALLERMPHSRQTHPAVLAALRRLDVEAPKVNLANLASEIGLSSRHFIDVFSNHTGLTPKVYARVRRFQSALKQVHAQTRPDWSDVAFDSGYSDQAHFIRDFKAFTGLTPSAYARLRGSDMHHVPVMERTKMCPIPVSATENIHESSPTPDPHPHATAHTC